MIFKNFYFFTYCIKNSIYIAVFILKSKTPAETGAVNNG